MTAETSTDSTRASSSSRGRGWVAALVLWALLTLGLGIVALWPTALDTDTATALRLFETLVSPQVILLVALLTFGLAFRHEVTSFLDRTIEVAMPGVGLRAAQREMKPDTAPPALADEAARRQTEEQQRNLEGSLQSANRSLRHWYLSYLSVFIVPLTQHILRWFEQLAGPISIEQYHAAWEKPIPDHNVRAISLNALLQHDLVRLHGRMLSFAESGSAFLSFLDGEWRPLEQDAPPARQKPQWPEAAITKGQEARN